MILMRTDTRRPCADCMMRMLRCAGVLLLLGAVCGGVVHGERIIRTSSHLPAQLAISAADLGQDIVAYRKAGDGPWCPVNFQKRDGTIVLDIVPEVYGASKVYFLMNPRQGVDLSDHKPPLLLGMKLDGRGIAALMNQHIGVIPEAPDVVTIGIADRENALDLDSVEVTLNEEVVAREHVTIAPVSERQATVSVQLGEVIGYGKHRLAVSVSDRAPLGNRLTVALRFDTFDATNYALAAQGTTLSVDSCMANYGSLVALNDGVRYPAAPGRLNDVSWASEDNTSDHWIEVDFGQLRKVSEVVVYWTWYRGTPYLPKESEVRIEAGGEWVKLDAKRIDGKGENCISTFRFRPIEVQKLRVYQLAGEGANAAPGYMWVTELVVR